MSSEILNEEDYKIILQNYSKNGDIKFVSAKYIPLSDNVEGFMGDYFILEITFLEENTEKTEKFFAKTMPTQTDILTDLAAQRNVYGKEIFFYDFLMKEYEKHGYDTSFAPYCYYCKDNKILIMENLVGKQFKLSEKNKPYDLDQIKAGLKALALYHGASILYEEEMTKKFGRTFRLNEEYPAMFKENYLNVEEDEIFSKVLFYKAIDCIKYVIDNNKDKVYKDEFEAFLNPTTVCNSLVAETSLRKATGHADLWYNNIFFNYVNSKAMNCKIVDFQILRYSPPALDVLLLIYLNSDKEFRKTHLKTLLMYYYDTLTKIFSKHGYEISKIFPIEDFKESLNFVETTAMFNVLCIGSLTFLPQDIMKEFYDLLGDDWSATHLLIFKKAFHIKKEFRKAIIESVDDFYDTLFRNNNNKYF